MKWLITLCLVVVAAVAGAWLLDNSAMVSVYWGHWRADVSLNLVVLVALASAWLLLLSVRAWERLRLTSAKAGAWRSRQRERHVWSAVLDGITYLLAGKHLRAQDAALTALTALHRAEHADGEKWPRTDTLEVLANWVLSESARSVGQTEQSERALQAALAVSAGDGAQAAREGLMLRAVDWALQDQDWTLAQRRLDGLPQGVGRRIQALRFKLKLARGQGNTTRALDVMRALAKHHAFSPAAAASLYSALAAGALREANDSNALKAVWSSLDATRQGALEVQCAWVQRRWALSSDEDTRAPLAAELLAHLKSWPASWDELGAQQRRLWVDSTEPLLRYLDQAGVQWVQALLNEHGSDVWVQYLAASAWTQQGLWGKAQTATDLVVKQRQLPPALEPRVWRLQALLADERGDQAAAQAAWRKAAEAACTGL